MSDRYSGRQGSSPRRSIATGLAFTVAFGIAYLATRPGGWFFIFPLVFAGILPLVNGLLALGRSGRVQDRRPAARPALPSAEKQVLQAARDEQGIVTPAVVALQTELSIQQAEQALEEMARKGYAVMRVTDSGRIEYEFPEFLPRLEAGSD
ncbi:MAG: hypothetical protein JW820_11560 [Spirochaetales bacterium]|nr:hypothetical protein [Spirochaetales bacterium]